MTDELPKELLAVSGGLKVLGRTYVVCPKHGKHLHTISSTIPGHEGTWCQICWLESLGEPLPTHREEV